MSKDDPFEAYKNSQSKSFRALNPHIFGGSPVEAPQPKPVAAQTLAGVAPEQQSRKKRMVCIVSLIACRRRLLDDDNNVASFKPLRDAIAETLGIDDGEKCLRWQCAQVLTTGREVTLVKVELK
jgi:hypothetical protein